ncbi:hypothetical protein OAO46_01745, partial [Candidatus Poseidonia alphae]|nr:hypothetical protein [Candidatus Poseidonia alphae]
MGKEGLDQEGSLDAQEEHTKSRNKEAKELQEIRQRRMGGGKLFLSKIEDFVLMGGLVYGILFALLLFSMSSGVFGNTTALDHQASTTFLDIGDECEEVSDEPWLNIFPAPDQELFSIAGHNLPNGVAFLNYSIEENGGANEVALTDETTRIVDEDEDNSGRAYFKAPFSNLPEGEYTLKFRLTVHEENNISSPFVMQSMTKTIAFELTISSEALSFLPFVDDTEHSDVRIADSGLRSCWTVQD